MGFLFLNEGSMANVSEKLTKKERDLIKKHYKFYKSLEKGEKTATTQAQKHFVDVCLGNSIPKTSHELAYAKYIGIYSTKKHATIIEDKNSEWEDKLKALQNALDNNKIKDQDPSLSKASKKNKSYKKKRTNPPKDHTSHKVVSKHQSIVESYEKIKKEILKKAKQRSDLEEYFKKKISKHKSEIPEYEEGYPKPSWFTNEDWKRMRRQNYADMKKHHRE
jgi:uncharacterized protein YifE (UPF0438 family)